MSVTEPIERFCSYFDREIDSIARLCHSEADATGGNGDIRRYRKSLLISAIDTLAGVRFSQAAFPQLARSNRERFLRFLREHVMWEARDLVSLPFLKDQLEKKHLNKSALAKYSAEQVARFSTQRPTIMYALDMDKPLAELAKMATSEAEELALTNCSHTSLLYRYRNYVVHESRTPGYAMEVNEEPRAHYSGYINNPHWHLAYTTPMFVGIAKNAISSLREYLTTNSIDPYDAVDDTTRW